MHGPRCAFTRSRKNDRGHGDREFLARIFQKLLLNFTWWVNRKDAEGNNVFEGGFLGLDNIGVFDRSQPLPTGGTMSQSDGTSWMAMYCLNMLAIALELSTIEECYEDVASKFWEHFLFISDAMNHRGEDGVALWNDEDGFYCDVLHLHDGYSIIDQGSVRWLMIPAICGRYYRIRYSRCPAKFQTPDAVVYRQSSPLGI